MEKAAVRRSFLKLFRWSGISDADDATGNARAGIADRLAAIVHFCMHNDAASENGIFRCRDRNVTDGDFAMDFAVVISLEVSQIARVAIFRSRQSVLVACGVVMTAGAHSIRGGAISELMDMEGVLLAGVESFDIGHDFDGVTIGCEAHDSVTLVACGRVQHGDGLFDGRRIGMGVFGRAQGWAGGEAKGVCGQDGEESIGMCHKFLELIFGFKEVFMWLAV